MKQETMSVQTYPEWKEGKSDDFYFIRGEKAVRRKRITEEIANLRLEITKLDKKSLAIKSPVRIKNSKADYELWIKEVKAQAKKDKMKFVMPEENHNHLKNDGEDEK